MAVGWRLARRYLRPWPTGWRSRRPMRIRSRRQARCWGLDAAEIAWGLADEWPMPAWARVTLARIDATPGEAQEYGGDRRLQALVQTAVVLAEQAETRLYVADEFDLSAALAELRLRSPDLDRIREAYRGGSQPGRVARPPVGRSAQVNGIAERLNRAADGLGGRDVEDVPTVRVDVYAERVQAAKLAAVAEFAAGASHEINNPSRSSPDTASTC